MVFIVGSVTENPGIEVRPVSRRTPRSTDGPEVIRLSVSTEPLTADAMTQQSKIAAALVKAGIRNPDAWAVAGVHYPEAGPEGDTEADKASGLLANGSRETKSPEPEAEARLTPALVLMKGPEDAPFLISWRSQRELGKAYLWQAMVMLGGGTILTLATLYLLLLKIHLL